MRGGGHVCTPAACSIVWTDLQCQCHCAARCPGVVRVMTADVCLLVTVVREDPDSSDRVVSLGAPPVENVGDVLARRLLQWLHDSPRFGSTLDGYSTAFLQRHFETSKKTSHHTLVDTLAMCSTFSPQNQASTDRRKNEVWVPPTGGQTLPPCSRPATADG